MGLRKEGLGGAAKFCRLHIQLSVRTSSVGRELRKTDGPSKMGCAQCISKESGKEVGWVESAWIWRPWGPRMAQTDGHIWS
jgi:hypothetical protein